MRWCRGRGLTALVLAACQGATAPPSSPGPPPPPPPSDVEPAPMGVGPAPLRRLTRVEYANSLRDLLGLEAPFSFDAGEDPAGPAGFDEGGVVAVNGLHALMETAEAAAEQAVRLPELRACTTMDLGCVRRFLAGFGARAFRRPVGAAELAALVRLYLSFRDRPGDSVADALRPVVAAILQSPKFLYHWETGCPSGAGPVPLCPHELAARLSYFFWSSLPDAALLESAARGELRRPEGIERAARRLLADPRARDTIGWFHRQWLGLGALEPAGSPVPVTRLYKTTASIDAVEQVALARAMDRETWEFTAQVLLAGDGRLETLLGAPFSFVDDRLARFYGAAAPAEAGFTRVPLAHRWGLLSQGSFLWVYATQADSHPIKRGKVIHERLLCGQLPEPPADIPAPKPASPTLPTRQRYAEHESNACARACHEVIDPLGFALESFDALGRYRGEDGGQPVDTSGVARFPLEGERPFADTAEFLRLLSTSEDVRRCVTRQWYRFALGRLETAAEEPVLEGLEQTFARSGHDVRELLVGIATSPSFRYRPEVGP